MKSEDEFSTRADAALYWFEQFGVQIIPVVPGEKFPSIKWDEWSEGLCDRKIKDYWAKHPDHDLGFIVGEKVIVFDADTPESITALKTIEESHGVMPKFVVETRRGEHHYFRRAPGTCASADGHDSAVHPERIDIRTGKSMIILPPSTGKKIVVSEAKSVGDLSEVAQEFIDSVYLMNGRQPPRPEGAERRTAVNSTAPKSSAEKIKALLVHLDPDLGYQDWLNVLMAIYHETCGSDEGLELADEWCQRGKKYRGFGEIQLKWRSFKSSVERPITIGTINNLLTKSGVDWKEVARPFEDFVKIESPSGEDQGNPTATEEVKSQSGTLLDRYSLTGLSAQLEKEAMEQFPIFGRIALQGQATVWYAAPNAGKTLIAMKLIVDAIEKKIVAPSKIYYLNMDDTSSGLTQKVKIAEDCGFHMIAEGYRGFKSSEFTNLIKELLLNDQARGTIVVLDTLKKFVDVMKKDKCSNFSEIVRIFVSKGGTVLALAHTNKNQKNGKPVPGGTSDISDDFDCSYIICVIEKRDEQNRKIVEFENLKRRGDVADKVAYSYDVSDNISYESKMLSVQEFSPDHITTIRHAQQLRSDEEIINAISKCIMDGVCSKMDLARAVAERSGVSRQVALKIIERYTGESPEKGRWKYTRGAHGKLRYELLEPASKEEIVVTRIDM